MRLPLTTFYNTKPISSVNQLRKGTWTGSLQALMNDYVSGGAVPSGRITRVEQSIAFVGRVEDETGVIYERVSGECFVEKHGQLRTWSGWFKIETGEPAQLLSGRLLIYEPGKEDREPSPVFVSGDIIVSRFTFGDDTLRFAGAGEVVFNGEIETE